MGFADESELHWVSYVHQMMHNFFSVKLQCTPLAHFLHTFGAFKYIFLLSVALQYP